MCSSTAAAEEIQMQRLRRSEPGDPNVRGSDRCFRFADGRTDEAQNMVEQPITAGLLKGKSINMHLIDRKGNETSPLFSINDKRQARMVVDYEENKVMFKDKPEEWYTLPMVTNAFEKGSKKWKKKNISFAIQGRSRVPLGFCQILYCLKTI